MPKAIGYSAMITSPDGKGVLLFGGYDYKNSHESNEILELKGYVKWIIRYIGGLYLLCIVILINCYLHIADSMT